MSEPVLCCRPKSLPPHLWEEAAKTAVRHNPANKPGVAGGVLPPLHIALLTGKYWGAAGVHLTVSFLDTDDRTLKAKILSHMMAWNAYANVSFTEVPSGGQVRIARAKDGYWSYLGTDILHIPAGQPTMNLQDFSLNTPESEYKRVVRHETGHTLGCPHEHQRAAIVARIDPARAKVYFLRMDGWDAQTVQEQVLTPLNESDLTATPADVTSIMAYQLEASIMKDGIAVPGGLDIDAGDGAFAAKIYPPAVTPPPPPPPPGPPPPTPQATITLAQPVRAGQVVRFTSAKPAGVYVLSAHEPAVLEAE